VATDHCGTVCDSEGLTERMTQPAAYLAIIFLFFLVLSIIATVSMFGTGQCAVPADANTDKKAAPSWVKVLYIAQAAMVATVTVGTGRAVSSTMFMVRAHAYTHTHTHTHTRARAYA
jgi:hypothetical protein